ncbi:class A beta-lactamase-related serine hydrolase [Kribbella pittospori]|uniref:Class A beta-lactamase-related serine hydrolase n=1 Tax=Kribbella pittospori TaxID=722689 RepID=A0A4R0KN11_9ACTN|nr:class A beta-lactamase-related serine hydrolase [Kribbella pittospori]
MSDFPVQTLAQVQHGMDLGWHTGAQVYGSVQGQTRVDLAVGEARPGVPMTTSTIVEWASATKPIPSVAIGLLWQRGLLDLDDPVCLHIPEFAAAGKQAVTIRHLLSHTGGLTSTITGIAPSEEMVADICAAPLADGWIPGTRNAYNSVAMWIVAELVSRVSGRPFTEFIRNEIFEPACMDDCWIGMSADTYRVHQDRIAVIPGFAPSGTEAWVTWGRPTGGGHGPIAQLGHFYEALLDGRLLSARTLEAMTAHQVSGGWDEYLQETVDRGLGFMLGSSNPAHGYGTRASARSFGHGGRTWSVTFADPSERVVVAVYWNGMGDPDTQARRLPDLLDALYDDLAVLTERTDDDAHFAC